MKKPCSNFQKMFTCLIGQSKHDDSRIRAGSICSDIRKVSIECHDCTAFLNTDSRQLRIAHTAQLLIENSHRVMTCPIEQSRHFGWEVFVQLEPHLSHSLPG